MDKTSLVKPSKFNTDPDPEVIKIITSTINEAKKSIGDSTAQDATAVKPSDIEVPAITRAVRSSDVKPSKILTIVAAILAALITAHVMVSQHQIYSLQKEVASLKQKTGN